MSQSALCALSLCSLPRLGQGAFRLFPCFCPGSRLFLGFRLFLGYILPGQTSSHALVPEVVNSFKDPEGRPQWR